MDKQMDGQLYDVHLWNITNRSALRATCSIMSLYKYTYRTACIRYFFEEKFFQEYTIIASNNLDPDQARHFVRPDLGPHCLQMLSTEDW